MREFCVSVESSPFLSSRLEESFLLTFLTSKSGKSSGTTLLRHSGFLESFIFSISFLTLAILSALPILFNLSNFCSPACWNVGIILSVSSFLAIMSAVITSVISNSSVPETSPHSSITSIPSRMSSPSSVRVASLLSIIQSRIASFTSASSTSFFQLSSISSFSKTISYSLPAHFILNLSILFSNPPGIFISSITSSTSPSLSSLSLTFSSFMVLSSTVQSSTTSIMTSSPISVTLLVAATVSRASNSSIASLTISASVLKLIQPRRFNLRSVVTSSHSATFPNILQASGLVCFHLTHIPSISSLVSAAISCFADFWIFTGSFTVQGMSSVLEQSVSFSISCSVSKLLYLSFAAFSWSSIALSTISKSTSSNSISCSLMSLIMDTMSPVLSTSMPPFQVFTTGSRKLEMISDMWSFWPLPALTTGLDGGGVPVSRDQPLWSLNNRYMGATLRLRVILRDLTLSLCWWESPILKILINILM